jgi:hypothetical protein
VTDAGGRGEAYSARRVAALVQAQLDATRSHAVNERYEIVFSSLDGMFPTEAIQVVQGEGLTELERLCDDARRAYAAVLPSVSPYGHILDAEWFFTERSRERIHRIALAVDAQHILLLGCPTLVDPFLKAECTVTLVDASSHGVEQFVADETHERLTIERRRIGRPDVAAPVGPDRFDLVVMDPPWYLPAYAAFLLYALPRIHSRAHIIYPLFKQLTRPTAAAERAELEHLAERLGACRVLDGALRYVTPTFEIESLRACRLPGLHLWRSADLVHLVHPSTSPDTDQALSEQASRLIDEALWDEFRFGDRLEHIVKVRVGPGFGCPPRLLAPASRHGYQLSTVSMRRLREHQADVWTSRNRTAVSCDPRRVADALAAVQARGASIDNPTLALDTLPTEDFDALRTLVYGRAYEDA